MCNPNFLNYVSLAGKWLGLSIVLFTLIWPVQSSLQSEELVSSNSLSTNAATSSWPGVQEKFAGLNAENGLGEWLWQRQSEYKGLPSHNLSGLRRLEEDLGSYLDEPSLQHSFPRHALEIQYHGTPVFQRSRNLKRTDMHSVASVTKTVTAVAIMLLVQENKLALDDDIALYFPEAPHLAQPLNGVVIRIRDLLQHSSGISYKPADGAIVYGKSGNIAYPIGRQFQPARISHSYSNFNYYILAALIEKVSGKSYQRFVKQRIFQALHMNHSRLAPISRGASGLHSSLTDMAWFMNAVFGQRLQHKPFLKKPYVEAMIQKPNFERYHPEMRYYALGVRVQYHNGQISSVFHSGIWNEMFGEMRYFPKTDASLVHIGNPPCFNCQTVNSYRWRSVSLSMQYISRLDRLFEHSSIPSSELVIKKQ